MRITVVGAGAMGSLFGGYLSKKNDVTLIEKNEVRANALRARGVRVCEKDGSENAYTNLSVLTNSQGDEADLIILFVKAMHTESALEGAKSIIGKNTYLLSMQNGSGHDEVLSRYADRDHVIIGTTQHNASVCEDGCVRHGGGGLTALGLAGGNSARIQPIADTFTACGFDCVLDDDIRRRVWQKLFINTGASALTALFQSTLGFIYTDPHANSMMRALIHEAVAVARTDGCAFDEDAIVSDVETVLKNASGGYTSIYADLKNGRASEVDTISGYVLARAEALGVPAPYHRFLVHAIHAMENKHNAKE